MKKLHRLLFLLLCAACAQQQVSLYAPPIFLETEQVQVHLYNSDTQLSSVNYMADFGDYLIVAAYREDGLLHLVDKNTGARFKSFGKQGYGSGMFYSVPIVNTNAAKSVLQTFEYAYGYSTHRTYKASQLLDSEDQMNLPDLEHMITFYTEDGEMLDEPKGATVDFLLLGDKRLFSRIKSRYRFIIQDSIGSMLSDYSYFPSVEGVDSLHHTRSYLQACSAAKPDGSMFAIASTIGCILEIFSVNADNHIVKTQEKRYYPPVFTLDKNLTLLRVEGVTSVGITWLAATNKYLYAKYSGTTYTRNALKGRTHTLAVFDWEGRPVKQYLLDISINKFLIDQERMRCYLTGYDRNDKAVMGYFDL